MTRFCRSTVIRSTATHSNVASLPTVGAAALAAAILVAALAGCATPEVMGPLRAETVHAVTADHLLIRFNAGQPQRLLASQPLRGLAAGDRLVGIDFRVARGVLYALSAQGRLYTLDTGTAQLTAVGNGAPVALRGSRFGVDFNPAADRVRVVSDAGQNLRLHPDTGALAATDPDVSFANGDSAASHPAALVAAAYTYNKQNDKLTTNFAIDARAGTLVMQGSAEGVQPAVSPNTGLLRTVGPLGIGAVEEASFDIADTHNAALAALRQHGRTRLFVVDLASGRSTAIGTVGDGRALVGMAIAP